MALADLNEATGGLIPKPVGMPSETGWPEATRRFEGFVPDADLAEPVIKLRPPTAVPAGLFFPRREEDSWQPTPDGTIPTAVDVKPAPFDPEAGFIDGSAEFRPPTLGRLRRLGGRLLSTPGKAGSATITPAPPETTETPADNEEALLPKPAQAATGTLAVVAAANARPQGISERFSPYAGRHEKPTRELFNHYEGKHRQAASERQRKTLTVVLAIGAAAVATATTLTTVAMSAHGGDISHQMFSLKEMFSGFGTNLDGLRSMLPDLSKAVHHYTHERQEAHHNQAAANGAHHYVAHHLKKGQNIWRLEQKLHPHAAHLKRLVSKSLARSHIAWSQVRDLHAGLKVFLYR